MSLLTIVYLIIIYPSGAFRNSEFSFFSFQILYNSIPYYIYDDFIMHTHTHNHTIYDARA